MRAAPSGRTPTSASARSLLDVAHAHLRAQHPLALRVREEVLGVQVAAMSMPSWNAARASGKRPWTKASIPRA